MITWFEYVKPRLASGESMQHATASYFERYFPDYYSEAKLIADETIDRAERLPTIPPEAEVPDDIAIGVQLVAAIMERQALQF